MQIKPYLFFDGRCEEAVEFYRASLGIEVTVLMRYKEAPESDGQGPKMDGEKIMHGSFKLGETDVLVSDGMCLGKPNFAGFALTLSVPNDDEAKRRFNALSEGGQVQMPLAKTFFSSSFGMLADRFGVSWIVIVE